MVVSMYLELLVVEPGLKGLEDGILCQRSLQPYQVLNVGQPAPTNFLDESLLPAALPLRRRRSRLGGRGSRLGGHRS